MNIIKTTLLGFLGALSLLPLGCESGGASGLAQTCSNSGDCEAGLLCINQVCIQNDYPVATTAKECVLVECSGDADCCDPDNLPADPESCASYQADCELDPTALSCTYYEQFCVCQQICDPDSSQCVQKPFSCTSDDQCPGVQTCDIASGNCVECQTDDECGTDEACIEFQCIGGCVDDEDCDLFESCNTESKRCEHTGCTSDRECILVLNRADAVCKTEDTSTGKPMCNVPCKENAECGANNVCDQGECKFLGCETDDECVSYFKARNQILPNPEDTVKARCVELGSMQ